MIMMIMAISVMDESKNQGTQYNTHNCLHPSNVVISSESGVHVMQCERGLFCNCQMQKTSIIKGTVILTIKLLFRAGKAFVLSIGKRPC